MKTILVIEDERSIRNNLVKILTHAGFEAIAAENGEKGVELAIAHLPDLIVCDILMPELNGYNVLTLLRQNSNTVSIPFIFLSAKADRSDIRHGMNLGADDYLPKPFTARELIDAINSQLNKQAQITQPYLDEIKKAVDAIGNMAHFDPLTNLPNRIFLHHSIQALMQKSPQQNHLAVLRLGVSPDYAASDFTQSEIEELFALAISERLKPFVDGEKVIARLTGLEFGVVVSGAIDKTALTQFAQQLATVITQPYSISEPAVSVAAAIGIACFPLHGDSASQLLSNADKARRSCQKHADRNFQFYQPPAQNAARTQQLKADLETAIQRSQFQLYYQPQISLLSGRIIGVEALLRWQHPQKGLILPLEFMAIAEEIGLMPTLDEWVLQTACLEAKTWRSYSSLPLQVCVNLSAHHLQKQTLVELVDRSLQTTQLSPRLLVLEFTEASLMRNPELILGTLQILGNMGVSIHIDDFGTAASSLTYLGRFPISCLKIDQSFIADLPNNAEHNEVVKAIIRIAQSFKLRVVAEGVETSEQLTYLQEHGCYGVQGFFYSPPVTAANLHELLLKDKQTSHNL